jgi:hypothetical protein
MITRGADPMYYTPLRTRPSSPDRRCARGEHCGNAAITPAGAREPDWALADLPYCHRCASAVGRALDAMPERYVYLRTHIGDKGAGKQQDRVAGSREAPTPLRLDVDALIRDMVLILVSWHERVAAAEGLAYPVTDGGHDLSRFRRDEVAIPAAVAVLTPRLDTVLQFGPSATMRPLPVGPARDDQHRLVRDPDGKIVTEVRGLDRYPGATGVVHPLAGWASVNVDLDGAAFGREIFWLSWMTRRLLGETIPPPERLDGIPCKGCDLLTLIVCPEPVYRSECTECGDLLTRPEYTDWVKLYSAWARRQVESGEVTPADRDAYERIAA